jgi:hypothetical protein
VRGRCVMTIVGYGHHAVNLKYRHFLGKIKRSIAINIGKYRERNKPCETTWTGSWLGRRGNCTDSNRRKILWQPFSDSFALSGKARLWRNLENNYGCGPSGGQKSASG